MKMKKGDLVKSKINGGLYYIVEIRSYGWCMVETYPCRSCKYREKISIFSHCK